MNGQAELDVDYKRKYKNLKRKLKFLVYVSKLCFLCLLMVCRRMFDEPHFIWACFILGARMFSRGAEKSTEKAPEGLQR